MTGKRLFKRSELEAAFALILPPATAAECAARWFSEIAGDDVDEGGYFLCQDWQAQGGMGDDGPDLLAVQDAAVSQTEREASEQRFWAGLSVEDRVELVMRFSDLHFALVALVSDEAAERLRLAAGLTPAQAARRREQMRRAVSAVGRSQ